MKLIAIDLGASYGWCFKHNEYEVSGHAKCVDLLDWGKQFKDLLELWKPEIVVLSQTNNFGFWNATRSMLMKSGIAFYICGKKGIPGIELNDTQARKAVFGKAIKKKEAQAIFSGTQADELDSIILGRGWYLINKNNNG